MISSPCSQFADRRILLGVILSEARRVLRRAKSKDPYLRKT